MLLSGKAQVVTMLLACSMTMHNFTNACVCFPGFSEIRLELQMDALCLYCMQVVLSLNKLREVFIYPP